MAQDRDPMDTNNSDHNIDTARDHMQSAQSDIGARIGLLTTEVDSLFELVDNGAKRISEPRILAWVTYAISIDCMCSKDGKIDGIIDGIDEIMEDDDLCRTMQKHTSEVIINTMCFVKSAVELLRDRQNFESLCVGLEELTKIVNTNLSASNDLKKISETMLRVSNKVAHQEEDADLPAFMPG